MSSLGSSRSDDTVDVPTAEPLLPETAQEAVRRLTRPWAAGIPVYQSYAVERGRIFFAADPAGLDSRVIFEGLGLGRGIAYSCPVTHRSESVERGYLVANRGTTADLLDAVTGCIRHVHADDCVEVEDRYRHPTIKEAVDA